MGVGSWEPKVRRMNDELGAKCTTVRMTRMRIGFSDKNWVKLGSFSFFEKVEIGGIVNV
jgi:hypothetical protein